MLAIEIRSDTLQVLVFIRFYIITNSVSHLRYLATIWSVAVHPVEQVTLDGDQVFITIAALGHGRIIDQVQRFSCESRACVCCFVM